jgi:polysaccharide export outer membrane protein
MRAAGIAIVASCLLSSVGCFRSHMSINGPEALSPRVAGPIATPPPGTVPTELSMVTLPPYVVGPPDNLLVEVVQRAKVPEFGADGKQLTDAKGNPIFVDGTQRLPVQPISGPTQIRPDGTINLGFWGSVQVAGLTLDQTAEAIREHLLRSKTLSELGTKPETLVVLVDVLAYNSKRYYVITDGGGYGEQMVSFPITGSETVLDALGYIYGLPSVASKRNIWVARRCPRPDQPWQILPVDWIGITQHGITTTNYQIMPGDRIYVKAQKIVTVDTALARFLSPIERLFGVTLLGANTVNQIRNRNNNISP